MCWDKSGLEKSSPNVDAGRAVFLFGQQGVLKTRFVSGALPYSAALFRLSFPLKKKKSVICYRVNDRKPRDYTAFKKKLTWKTLLKFQVCFFLFGGKFLTYLNLPEDCLLDPGFAGFLRNKTWSLVWSSLSWWRQKTQKALSCFRIVKKRKRKKNSPLLLFLWTISFSMHRWRNYFSNLTQIGRAFHF